MMGAKNSGTRKKFVGVLAVTGAVLLVALLVFASLYYPWNTMISASGFTAAAVGWYVPGNPDYPAARFSLDIPDKVSGTSGWNLQIRKYGGGILREVFGNTMVPARLAWDGLSTSADTVPPGTDCQAILTVNSAGTGMHLYQARFTVGIGVRSIDDGYEVLLGPVAFPGSGADANRYGILDEDEIKKVEPLAHALKSTEEPRMTIEASGLTRSNPAEVDGVLAMKRAAFVRRVLQSAGVGVGGVELAALPLIPGSASDIRIVLARETVEQLLESKGRN